MHELTAAVRAWINAHRMIQGSALVVVAVSGGPDSLCLLHVLRTLAPELGVPLHVAHLDHQIRGAESAAEARFVAELARAWGLPATVVAADVPALAARTRANLHAAARAARYAFLAQVARATGAQAVAVAHHAGDQAETVLLHLLRGAGPEGLSGMAPATPWPQWAPELPLEALSPGPALIRPLLPVERAAIERYCAAHALDPRHDPSNDDLAATRNRIRHDLLPRLIEYNPHIVAALGRTAAICADEQQFLAAALDEHWPALVSLRPGGVDFDGAAWNALHPALQRAALRRAYALLARGHTLTLEHIEQARALVSCGVGRRLALPGQVWLQAGYSGFTLGEPAAPQGPQLAVESIALPEHGAIDLGRGWSITVSRGAGHVPPAGGWALELDAERLPMPLVLRRRRPGDRLRLAEGGGSRRVQDLFVDAKLPRALRDAWPIVAGPAALVWVVGLRAAAEYRPAPGCRHTLTLAVARHGSG